MTEEPRDGDRYLMDQLKASEKDIMTAINGMRDRHHESINHISNQFTAQSVQVFTEMAAMRVDVNNIKAQLLEHTHPEMQRIHDSLSSQIADLRKDIAVDRASDLASEKTALTTRATVGWTLGAVATVFGIFVAILTIMEKA